jgi:predicted ATPase
MFNLELSNFRSFEFQNFQFSKINILIGENSSGKSSLFKLILALKQSLQPPSNREINLSFTGEYADLGSYKDAIYYQDDTLPLTVAFSVIKNYSGFFYEKVMTGSLPPEIKDKRIQEIKKSFNIEIESPNQLTFTFSKHLDKHESIKTTIKNADFGEIEISFPKRSKKTADEKVIFGPRCKIVYRDYEYDKTIELNDVEYQKDGFMTIIVSQSLFGQISKIFDVAENKETKAKKNTRAKLAGLMISETIYHRIAYLLVTQNFLKYYLEKVDYINPIYTKPSRVYLYKDAKQSSRINDIEDVVQYFGKNTELSRSIFSDFINILKTFGIAEGIEVVKNDRLPVRELKIKVKDLLSNITDVGYGVSLQLPIILKALLSDKIRQRRNSIILIEQPEVHLHPQLHAQLIEIILSLSKGTTYFIETHSEHIIRKLQVLIKEGKYNLKPDDVTIHYLKRIKKKTEVTTHKILLDGLLEPNLPAGFFDNSYSLAKDLLK